MSSLCGCILRLCADEEVLTTIEMVDGGGVELVVLGKILHKDTERN